MTVEEKTCQLVTLYGYKRVLQDSLPTPGWKDQLWKDGLGAIDEHLNGFVQWGKAPARLRLGMAGSRAMRGPSTKRSVFLSRRPVWAFPST